MFFSRQMTEHVKESLCENSILLICVPANMTNMFQTLDLTVNHSFKASVKKEYTKWYSKQITGELDRAILLGDIEIKLHSSVLKLFYAKWLVDSFNFVISQAESEVIPNRWKAAGITETFSKGLSAWKALILSNL